MTPTATELLYLVSAALFILALRWMSQPETARRAVVAAVIGMALAVGGTLLHPEIVTYKWIAIAAVAGIAARHSARARAAHGGAGTDRPVAGVRRPGRGARRHGEVLPVARTRASSRTFRMAIVAGEVILGCLTCTGGLIAAGKLAEWITDAAGHLSRARTSSASLLLGVAAALGVWLTIDPTQSWAFPIVIVLALDLRRAADSADRRRRHADGHLVPELLRRAVGRRDGLRAREQAAHRRRRARRRVGLRAVDHHVQGDEPIGDERAVRRVRIGAGRRPRPPNSGP